MQNTTNITQTRRLDNKFILVAELFKDKGISNSTDQVYLASAKTLAVGDY
jgi:hypothetical protein